MINGVRYDPKTSEKIREFWEWAFGNNPHYMKPRYLYHYTKPDVLEKICRNFPHGIFLTCFACLNDRREFQLGRKLVSLYWDIHNLEKPDDEDVHSPWIFSLSTEKDDQHQWNSYTDPLQGGYSLEFDVEKLLKEFPQGYRGPSDATTPEDGWIDGLALVPCIYITYSIFEKLIEWRLEHNQNQWDNLEIGDDQYFDFKSCSRSKQSRCKYCMTVFNTLISILDWFHCEMRNRKVCDSLSFHIACCLVTSMIKSDYYKPENEWRLVGIASKDYIRQYMRNVGGKCRIPLFPESCNQTDFLSSIMISPHGDGNQLEHKAIRAKEASKANKCQICHSSR